MRVEGACPAMLARIFHRRDGLRPEAVAAAVPEQKRAARHPRQRHRAAVGHRQADRARLVVLELPVDQMAGRAGDVAVLAEPLLEEQRRAERRRQRIVRIAVGRVGRQGRECRQRQRRDRRLLGLRQLRLATAGQQREGADQQERLDKPPHHLKRDVEHHGILSGRRLDGEFQLPPPAHVEAHAIDLVAAFAQVTGNRRAGR
jgi:hypothetical protein